MAAGASAAAAARASAYTFTPTSAWPSSRESSASNSAPRSFSIARTRSSSRYTVARRMGSTMAPA